jgi:hypothetical protein
MLLYELAAPNPLLIRLAASTSQLKGEIDAGSEKPDWTTDELLDYYRSNDIPIDRSLLLSIVTKPPLNKWIANIQGDTVVFKGQDEGVTSDEDQNQEVVQQMAQNAMK